MFKLLAFCCILAVTEATYFITKVNETVHQNVVISDSSESWNPEMYAKKIILRNFTGSISPQTFSLLKDLEELYFVHSSIDFIQAEAFKNIPKLKILQFSYNIQLPFMSNEIFRNCRNLKKIVIGNNKFVEGISEVLFSDLTNVTHIEVTKESKMPRTLKKDFFHNSKSLESIKLHFSNITVIESDSFEGLDRLNFLSLAENELLEIGSKAFRSKNLIHLYLGWNKLKYFTGEELFSLTNLKNMDISFNPLIEIDVRKIRKNAPGLKSLSAARTSLTCSKKEAYCEAEWAIISYSHGSIRTSEM